MDFGIIEPKGQILSTFYKLDKLIKPTEFHFPHLSNGNTKIYLARMLRG